MVKNTKHLVGLISIPVIMSISGALSENHTFYESLIAGTCGLICYFIGTELYELVKSIKVIREKVTVEVTEDTEITESEIEVKK